MEYFYKETLRKIREVVNILHLYRFILIFYNRSSVSDYVYFIVITVLAYPMQGF